MLSIKKFITKR